MTGDSEPISDEALARIERRAKHDGGIGPEAARVLLAEVVRLRASLTAVERVCAEAEQRSLSSYVRDFYDEPFPVPVTTDEIRAAISGAAGGSGVTP